ncbi:MAG: transposase [Candidatus Paracaedibacteraceae bacterium]|nr:transposase [Candidatus Paracaedibacteraceae bacterium]
MPESKKYQSIPIMLEENEFNEFVFPHLTKGSRGPGTKITFHRIFNYILKLMHTGCQWKELPIEKDIFGKSEIHYTRLFRIFQRWLRNGCFDNIFIGSVYKLFENNLLDTDIIHGDGSTTTAKKGAIT